MEQRSTQLDIFDLPEVCAKPGCATVLEARKNARGFCWNHYMDWRRDNAKRYEFQCSVCGITFLHHRPGMKVCGSNRCVSTIGSLSAADSRRKASVQRRRERKCVQCGLGIPDDMAWGTKNCSSQCRDAGAAERAIAARSPLRKAIEAWDKEAMVAELLERVTIEGDLECWVWPTTDGDGYSSCWAGGLYRKVLEVNYGQELGTQAAHHACHNRACVRPDHLQPVTHRENTAEMLAHQSLLSRIRELEDRVRELCPDDPLLKLIEVA